MNRLTILPIVLAVAACGTTPAQQDALVTAGQTLASVAASRSTTVADLVARGTLFCRQVAPLTPAIVVLATAAGAPVSVIGQTADDVARACAAVRGVPVVPPADAGVVVVVAPVGLPGV